jgi:hypothetical protein
MKIIKPNNITLDTIVSSSLAETEPAWSSSANYTIGNTVYDGYDGIYQAITNNTNKKPSTSATDWVYVKPTNRLALFDSQINTVSTSTSTITLTLKTGNMQGIALLNLIANNVSITVTNGLAGDIIYTSSQSLVGTVIDWYQYFFFDLETQKNQTIFIDIPQIYIDTYTTVEIIGTGTISVGTLTFGRVLTLGKTEYGTSSGITDYSVKQTDEFGQTNFVQRAFSKRVSGRVLVSNAELNRVQRTLYDIRAVPCLWFASDNPTYEEALVVFGYYRDFSTDISYPEYSYCNLEIEGLI